MSDTVKNLLRLLRGVEWDDRCPTCVGWGAIQYATTGTWQRNPVNPLDTPTTDVCNTCWGTGKKSKHGVSLNLLEEGITNFDVLKKSMGH